MAGFSVPIFLRKRSIEKNTLKLCQGTGSFKVFYRILLI